MAFRRKKLLGIRVELDVLLEVLGRDNGLPRMHIDSFGPSIELLGGMDGPGPVASIFVAGELFQP